MMNPHVAMMGNMDLAARLKIDYTTLTYVSDKTELEPNTKKDDQQENTNKDQTANKENQINENQSVKTGDQTSIQLFMTLFIISITMIGFILLSMAYISFGMLVSSLTENQVIAAVVTLVFSLIPFFISYGDGIFSNLALINLFQKFPTNVISLKEIVGLLSFTIMCITITIIVIQRKKCLK